LTGGKKKGILEPAQDRHNKRRGKSLYTFKRGIRSEKPVKTKRMGEYRT